MKKFSWIFALILALSLAFIGCPAADDDDTTPTKPGNQTPVTPPEPPFEVNPNVTAKSIVFGNGTGETEVYFERGNGSKPGVTTYADGGYTYEYSAGDNAYGHSIGRFMVDLGTDRLGDYGGIEFKWKGISGDVGLSDGNRDHPEYTKNLFILASGTEDGITPWKSDDDVAALIVNTDYFKDGLTGKKLYDGAANVPCVKGQAGYKITATPNYDLEPYTIATPFVLKKTLTGEVWLSFYFHATGGSYSVSDVKLIPAAAFEKKDPPAPPPAIPPSTDPTEIPSEYSTFDLVLSGALTATSSPDVTGGNATSSIADGKLTSTFTANGMRLVFPLTTEQKTLLGTGADAQTDIYIKLEGVVKTDSETTGDAFRYSLAQKDAGSNWATTSLPEGKLETLLLRKVSWNNQNNVPDSFILQHRNANEITIEITKITIGYMAGATVTGIAVKTEPTNNIYQVNVTHFDPSGLVITATYSDSTTLDVAYSHDAGFAFTMTAGGGAAIPLTPGTTTFSAIGDVTVTVTYEGASATYTATVSADAPPEVESFVIKTQPTKTAYKKGIDSFNPAGLVITATYDKDFPGGGRTKDIAYDTNADDFEFADGTNELEVDESKFSANATITVTYEEKTATFAITVSDITAIAVKTNPKVNYFVGDKFNPAGLVLTATYGDAGDDDVAYNSTAFAFKDGDDDIDDLDTYTFDAVGSKTLTVTYKALTASINVTVAELGAPTLAGVTIAGVAGVTDTTVKITNSGGGIVAVTDGYTANITKGYGNSNVIFSVDLGTKTLGDYEKVTINFKGVSGDYGNKNIFLLASNTEADITLWKSDGDIKAAIANSDTPSTNLWDGAWGVATSGSLGATVASKDLTIKTHTNLTGIVWFSIYMHGNPNSVTITDITFVEAEEGDE